MPANNERLKAALHDAKLICRQKFQTMEAKHGQDNPVVRSIFNELHSVFNLVDTPSIWAKPVPYEENKLMTCIAQIDAADINDLVKCQEISRQFFSLLHDEILKEPLERLVEEKTSLINLQVMNALRLTEQKIAGRKVFFKNQGHDLDKDPEFQPLALEQRKEVEKYRELLKTNAIQAMQTDVILINRFGIAIQQAAILKDFITLFKGLTEVVKSKIPQA